MANNVQQLLLKIDANAELARRELAKMGGDFDTFTRRSEIAAGTAENSFGRIDKAASAARSTLVGFAAGIGVSGIAALGRTILQAADEIDAAAEKAGIGVERYQSLRESLRALEVEGEKVDGIFARLTDTLGAVQGGTAAGGVNDALDKMGVRSRILNGEITTTDGLLDAIAASAGRFTSQAEFTATVVDVVGRKLGIDLANAVKDGGAALKAGEQAFRDAGGVIDAEYIAKLADANEAIDKFTSQSKSKLIIWSGQAIQAIENVGDQARGLGEIFRQEGIFGALSSSGTRATLMGIPEQRRGVLQQDVNSASIKLQQAERARARGGFLDQLGAGSQPNIAQLTSNLRQAEARLRAFEAANPKPQGGGEAAITGPVPRVRRDAGGATGATAARPAAAPAINDALNRQGGYDFADLSGALVGSDGKIKGVAEQLDGIRANLGEINVAAIDLANADILDLGALQRGNALLRDASQSITDAIFGATSLGDALVNTFARAGASLIENSLFDLLTGAVGGSAGGLAGKAGKLLGFANGGRPPVGVASIVGERGPELFVPRVPGTIIPNHKLGGSGGGVTNYNDFRGAVVTEDLYARIDATGQRAAQAGALGGRQLAAADNARRARRRMT